MFLGFCVGGLFAVGVSGCGLITCSFRELLVVWVNVGGFVIV